MGPEDGGGQKQMPTAQVGILQMATSLLLCSTEDKGR